MSTLFAFLLLLSVLIFVHELGHFLVAKACGVRVLKFSLGFGPPIGIGKYRLSWTHGHTEYVVAWIPLGGFVKMLGESPDEIENHEALANPDETLNAKPLWQKLSVVFAGPAMNLVLPVFVFMTMLFIGLPTLAPVVGMVEPGSPAERAGLRTGDEIVAIDGAPTENWRQVVESIRANPDEAVAFEVDRDGDTQTIELSIESRSAFDEFGTVKAMGWAGFAHSRLRALVGIPDATSPARIAGLRSGDLVSAVDGEAVSDWSEFERALESATGAVTLSITRPLEAATAPVAAGEARGEALEFTLEAGRSLAELGIVPATVLVDFVEADSPAMAAGIAKGDLILAVDGAPVGSFGSFAEVIRTGTGETLKLVVARGGEPVEALVTPVAVETDLGFGVREPRYRIGIGGVDSMVAGASVLVQVRNPLVSLPRAIEMTIEQTELFLQGLSKMFSGEVSSKNVGGPILIAEVAGDAWERGWEIYLFIMVVISINLGILNLLPIPILDGGQAVLFLIEGVKRSPLSVRSREIFQSIGITVLLMLMGLAFWNDISRNWYRVIEYFSS